VIIWFQEQINLEVVDTMAEVKKLAEGLEKEVAVGMLD
jgi:hypothetical protein